MATVPPEPERNSTGTYAISLEESRAIDGFERWIVKSSGTEENTRGSRAANAKNIIGFMGK